VTKKSRKKTWVAVSGGFDPLHIGHVRMFKQARKLGDKLVVILNNDNWLVNKKGFVFMTEKERKEVIEMFPFVDKVVITKHKPRDKDMSVVHILKTLKPAIFANGGDRKPDGDPIPEVELCNKLDIKLKYNLGHGGKIQSSSWLLSKARRDSVRSIRPWGEFYDWDSGKHWYIRTLYIKAGKQTGVQYHEHRLKSWVLADGDVTAVSDHEGIRTETPLKHGDPFVVRENIPHRLKSKKGGIAVEIAVGDTQNERDLIRVEDPEGRKLNNR
jgi:D-beta-D-heptose 7-phosphate kinase/D-beta-D-heptose 1-phosphate adenosyltransferase